MDRDVIRDFWRRRAASGSTRWTDDDMLLYEREMLRPLVPPTARILDLGSGFGELSLRVVPEQGSLVAVDQEPRFAEGFVGNPRAQFHLGDVATFLTDEVFDVVLLFGVVTYLVPSAEAEAYGTVVRALSPDGLAIVKNQCSDSESFTVDKCSEALGTRYVGRYPSVAEQSARLGAVFANVEVHPYPEALRVHPDSHHVAFVCRRPIG